MAGHPNHPLTPPPPRVYTSGVSIRIGSLFSGAGGLDMAVAEVSGGTVAWYCELDPAASKVLAYRFPDAPNLGDITKADWTQVEPVDVLCGGFPCQDVSSAGKRAGLRDGTRSGLWSVFADLIELLRPPIVVIENVRGLLSAKADRCVESGENVVGDGAGGPVLRAAGAVLGDLADLGYDAVWATVAAADVGAPHRRERVFIVARIAHPSSDGLEGHDASLSVDSARGGWEGDTFGSVGVAHAPDTSSYGRDEGRPEPARLERGFDAAVSGDGPVNLLPTPRTSDTNGAGLHGTGGPDLRTAVTLLPTPQARDWKDSNSGSPAEIDRRTPNLGAVSHYLPTSQSWGKYGPAIQRWENATRPAPAPTEPNSKGNPRLSAAFSEWMMGWPDGWVTDVPGIKRNDALRIVGNGVCPQQAIAALRYLLVEWEEEEMR